MAKKSVKPDIFGWEEQCGVLEHAVLKPGKDQGEQALLYFIKDKAGLKTWLSSHKQQLLGWQAAKLEGLDKEVYGLSGQNGPVWVVNLSKVEKNPGFDLYPHSPYARMRNLLGHLWPQLEGSGSKKLAVYADSLSVEEKEGCLVGMELAHYRYLRVAQPKKNAQGEASKPLTLLLHGITESQLAEAKRISCSINLARHLVNTPANLLNPTTYAEALAALFKGYAHTKVDVWQKARIQKEGMGLLMGVGQGAVHGPTMLHVRYRPTAGKSKRPIAFVGKGITFDSGGLDIKPASAMRLMKKDMGGSASVAGIAFYILNKQLPLPCDFYLPMAENMVDQHSFRPGDVLTARNGHTVEIDNTDAEGRLILADAIDVAVTQKGADEPRLLIDVATLTGAARVALGTEVGAMFATDDDVATDVYLAGRARGDYVWRLPLVQSYDAQLSSSFADTNHCSTSGFGGAITAALFLRKFVRNKPWIHLDVMGWGDAGKNGLRETGGNGQAVQCLIEFVKNI